MSTFAAAQPGSVFDSTPQADSPSREPEPPPMAVNANGRVYLASASRGDCNLAVLMHLSPFSFFFFPVLMVVPLVVWLVRKDQSPYVDDHGKEVVNFLISFIVLHLLLVASCFLIIGIPVALVGIPALWIVGMISLVRGAVAAGRAELFRYPMTIRFLS